IDVGLVHRSHDVRFRTGLRAKGLPDAKDRQQGDQDDEHGVSSLKAHGSGSPSVVICFACMQGVPARAMQTNMQTKSRVSLLDLNRCPAINYRASCVLGAHSLL